MICAIELGFAGLRDVAWFIERASQFSAWQETLTKLTDPYPNIRDW